MSKGHSATYRALRPLIHKCHDSKTNHGILSGRKPWIVWWAQGWRWTRQRPTLRSGKRLIVNIRPRLLSFVLLRRNFDCAISDTKRDRRWAAANEKPRPACARLTGAPSECGVTWGRLAPTIQAERSLESMRRHMRTAQDRSHHAIDVEPAIKQRCRQNDNGDRTQDVLSALLALPCLHG
jgi:hypothetical protein